MQKLVRKWIDRPGTFANLMYCYSNSTIHLDTGTCGDKNVYTYTTATYLGISFTTGDSASTSTSTASGTGTPAANVNASATVTLTVTTGLSAALETAAICADSVGTSQRNTGLAVGLGTGLPFLGLACVFAALWLVGRRAHNKEVVHAAEHSATEPLAWDKYLYNHSKDQPQEADSAQLAEMRGERAARAVELDARVGTASFGHR
ncbi:MAG: hypothetical protein M1829_002355 [Trizodia sp. TS-e1964]|nr:MAG: hypothetical protein M1829_002355 [Trizodia sp. TS-e1964]